MNLIIPMAGKGTRLRPQTLTTPKPLIEIAGKTIIQRIVDIITQAPKNTIKNIGFIIEQPHLEIEQKLHAIAKKNKIKSHVFYQHKAKGTAHAIFCAKQILNGPVLIVFSDTLFEANLTFPKECDGVILVKKVKDPSAYGVVKVNEAGQITAFIEKPKDLVSNLAIVGIYYFKDGLKLSKEIEFILKNNIKIKGEYQITTVLENLKNQNLILKPHTIEKWFDFGTPNNLLSSHAQILKKEESTTLMFSKSKIINPCYIASDATIINSTIGPNVSIGAKTIIENSTIQNTIIQSNTKLSGIVIKNSIIGNFVEYKKGFKSVNIGDYSQLK